MIKFLLLDLAISSADAINAPGPGKERIMKFTSEATSLADFAACPPLFLKSDKALGLGSYPITE